MKEPIKAESDCGYWFMSDGPWMVDLATKSGQKALIKALREHAKTCNMAVRIEFPEPTASKAASEQGGAS